jgi:omega-6 fatty acid desaturase (delta-12 desaturase)
VAAKKGRTMKTVQEEKNNWKDDIAPFLSPDVRKSAWQIVNSTVPFFVLWCLAYLSLSVSFWITLACAIPAAGLLVRIFIIFHDCCHHSFFKSRKANVVFGIITGMLTFFPYYRWQYEHFVHHATSSNLNRKGTGDIWTLTVDEYLALTPFRRMVYRMYRNPFVMFGLGPIYLVLIAYRFNRKRAGRRERLNTHATNFGLVVMVAILCWTLGWQEFLLVEGPILYLSGLAGIWLFYVQHQFEGTYFEKEENWDYVRAALHGSSFYKLPRILQWMTGNIGFHHIHHLGPRVPNYNLPLVHESNPSLRSVPAISLLSSFRCLRHRLWDEERKRFVRFRDVRSLKSGI